MQRDPRAYLFDISAAADAIDGFLKDAEFGVFVENDMLRSAVERKFEIIGEALSRLARRDPVAAEQITGWRDIIGFRNILAHGYAAVDYAIVWRTYTEALPVLRADIAALMASWPRD